VPAFNQRKRVRSDRTKIKIRVTQRCALAPITAPAEVKDKALIPVTLDITIDKKKKTMESIFSKTLLDEIGLRLRKKENVIILQNRRGFATNIFCNDCGEVITCDDCSVSMVHHLNKNILQCHYCGIIKPVPKACPLCGSLALKFFGTGTQRVEDELSYYFPTAKIERVDSDSINKKGKLGEILNSFGKGEIDILVGIPPISDSYRYIIKRLMRVKILKLTVQ